MLPVRELSSQRCAYAEISGYEILVLVVLLPDNLSVNRIQLESFLEQYLVYILISNAVLSYLLVFCIG